MEAFPIPAIVTPNLTELLAIFPACPIDGIFNLPPKPPIAPKTSPKPKTFSAVADTLSICDIFPKA